MQANEPIVAQGKKVLGYTSNKDVPINSIVCLDIKGFRTLEGQQIRLGQYVTVLSGRNGTMKTSLMGLIAHPFDSDAKDAFGSPLKTTLREVFKLSPQYDQSRYEYDLVLEVGRDVFLKEQVSIYWVGDKTKRHRIVVSGAEKGDGNFTYNTSFLNLKRLFPLVHTSAAPDEDESLKLSTQEAAGLKDFYESIFPSSDYGQFAPIHEKRVKTTFAPSGEKASYDWQSISSGEDNLGAIYNRMLGFQRAYDPKSDFGNGILCIDEFESSLHPVAQLRLFDYLYRWANRYKVQVVLSTHSLHLIQHVYLKHTDNLNSGRVVLNFLSKSNAQGKNIPILHNPQYSIAFKELTLESPEQAAISRKVKVLCEDEFAIHFAKRLLGSNDLLNLVDFHSSLAPASENNGTAYSSLAALCIQYPLLLRGSFVIFDADVPKEKLDKIKNKDLYLQFPDASGLAIERRIIAHIVSLENGDPFFKKFDKERDAFLDDFKRAGIKSLTPADIEDERIVSIKHCKAWATGNSSAFKKYVTYYAKKLDSREYFVQFFISRINVANLENGLPLIKTMR